MNEGDIVACDETAVWFDATSNKTIALRGEKSIGVASTGHDKANVTILLATASNGSKKRPLMVIKGKGKSKEDKILQGRRDIKVVYSDNGWMNDTLTVEWLNFIFADTFFGNGLLIWDSYRCHISKITKAALKKKRVDSCVIPGGCTGLIQAPDVSWNKPFKGCLRSLYDKLLENGNHTFTKQNNIRSPSKSELADMVVYAWDFLSENLIKDSFLAVGQIMTCNPELVSCFKEGRQAAQILPEIKKIWNKNPLSFESEVVLEEEECEDELDNNELVIRGPQDSQDPQGSQDSQDSQDRQDSQDPQDPQDPQDSQDPQKSQDHQDPQDHQDSQDPHDSQDHQDRQDSQDSQDPEVESICSSCEYNNEAKFACKECQDTLCNLCYDAHLKVKLTKNHTITPLQRASFPWPEGQYEAIIHGKMSPLKY